MNKLRNIYQYKHRLIYISILFTYKKSEQLKGRDESRNLSSPIVSPLWSILENLQKPQWWWERGGKKTSPTWDRCLAKKDLAHVFSRFFREVRSQRQVSGDPKIRNGCKPAHTTADTIEKGRMPPFCEWHREREGSSGCGKDEISTLDPR